MFNWKPEQLACGPLVVRPIRRADQHDWLDLRSRNREWLRPWEATSPLAKREKGMSFNAFVRQEHRQWRRRLAINTVIEFDGELVGRIAIAGVEWGSARTGSLGYWIDQVYAGRGIVPRAVGMITKYGFAEGLHRVELSALPNNEGSLRIAQKLGFRDEGRREKYLFIDGAWRDHRVFALTAEDKRFGEYWDCPKKPTG